jgi:DNA-binding IclR family transcriptional regulator
MTQEQIKLLSLDPYLFKTYVVLKYSANKDDKVLISINHLTRMLGFSRSKTIYCLKDLMNLGYLNKYRTSNHANIYEVLV